MQEYARKWPLLSRAVQTRTDPANFVPYDSVARYAWTCRHAAQAGAALVEVAVSLRPKVCQCANEFCQLLGPVVELFLLVDVSDPLDAWDWF